MRVRLLVVGACLVAACGRPMGARPPADVMADPSGEIAVEPISHATVQVTQRHHVILVDPTASAGYDGLWWPLSINYEGLKPPTLILVTHMDSDHFDSSLIASVRAPSTTVVVPPRSVVSRRGR